MLFGLKSEELEMIFAVFREFSPVDKVIIFGSRAMGNFKPGSDVDLAIQGKINEDILAQLRIRLNEDLPLPYEFDVFDLKTITKKALRNHISEFGKILYFNKKSVKQ